MVLHQLLDSTGRLSQLDAQGLHGPLAQDAAAEVQLLQARLAAEHGAEVFPPLVHQGLDLHPTMEKEGNTCLHRMDLIMNNGYNRVGEERPGC